VAVAALGARYALFFSAAAYAASSAVALSLPGSSVGRVAGGLGGLRAGWSSFRSRRWLWVTDVWYALSAMVVQAPLYVLGPTIARSVYGGAAGWGLLLGAVGAGALAGGLLAARLAPRRTLRSAIAVYGITFTFPVVLALAAPVVVVLLAAVGAGCAAGFFSATWFAVFQRNLPPELIACTSGWDWLGSLAALPVGMIVVGRLAEVVSTAWILIGGTTVAAALTAGVVLGQSVGTVSVTGADSEKACFPRAPRPRLGGLRQRPRSRWLRDADG
jgi:hypothetical protein